MWLDMGGEREILFFGGLGLGLGVHFFNREKIKVRGREKGYVSEKVKVRGRGRC